eukprot:968638-Amphidinium_carterae.1
MATPPGYRTLGAKLPENGLAAGFGRGPYGDEEPAFYLHWDAASLKPGNFGTAMVMEAGEDRFRGAHPSSTIAWLTKTHQERFKDDQ